jgi:Spy/CpxP family protein refolding chaperone
MAGMGKGEPRGGQRLNDLKGELSLNEEQTNQWDAITDQYRSKMRSLKQDESVDDAQRKDSMRELKDGMNKELLGILNPEQQKLFNEETEKQKNQMKQHQNGMNPSK